MGVAKFLKAPVGKSRGENMMIWGTMGVATGATNNVINKNYIARGKAKYKTHKLQKGLRRIHGIHGDARKGGA